MKLDYINKYNEYGDNIVRLYDFDRYEALKFQQLITLNIILDKKQLDLTLVDFIQLRNCGLILRITNEDIGIWTKDRRLFYCDLTIHGYEQMVALLEPFCNKETKGYQWLYDIDSPTDFLFSPGGTW